MRRRRDLLIALALALAVIGLYARTAGFDFVHFDDNAYVIENTHVRAGLTWSNIGWAFTTFTLANWHPLTWLSYMADVQLFGGPRGPRPGAMHLVNVVFHAANTVLLFALLRAMTGASWRSALAAALFGLHPLHVESVAWIAERKDVLCGFFMLLTMTAYVRYARGGGWRWYTAFVVLFALALMAKPMAVTLPGILLLLDYWPLKRPARWGRLVLEKMPLMAMAVGDAIVTYLAQSASGTVKPFEAVPLGARLANALLSYVAYLGQMVWPRGLAVPYPMRETFAAWQVAGAALLLALITVAALYLARRGKPYVAVGWFWYLGTLLPVIGIMQVGDQAMADRYTYVPLIGPFIAIAWAAGELAAGINARLVAAAVVACLFAGMFVAFVQIGHWRDTDALFSHAVRVDENNWLAWHELALYRAAHSDPAGAEDAYRRALRVKPSHFLVNYNYGNLLVRQQRPAEAFDRFATAVAANPKFAEAHANLGWMLLGAGQIDNAEREFHEALRLKPNLEAAERGLAKANELRAASPH